MNKLTQIPLSPSEGFTGYGPLGNPQGEGVSLFQTFLSSVIGLITIIAIIWFVFTLILGAVGMIGAGGDKAALESSRKKIATGLIGMVVVIAALFIVDLFGYLLGIPDILDIEALFGQIQL